MSKCHFVRRTYLEILIRTPAEKSETSMALPPWLMKVKGTPVRGMTPSIPAILTNASIERYEEMPTARSAPKGSAARKLTRADSYQRLSDLPSFCLGCARGIKKCLYTVAHMRFDDRKRRDNNDSYT